MARPLDARDVDARNREEPACARERLAVGSCSSSSSRRAASVVCGGGRRWAGADVSERVLWSRLGDPAVRATVPGEVLFATPSGLSLQRRALLTWSVLRSFARRV